MNSSSHDKTPRSSLKMLPSEDGSPALSEGNLRPFSRTSSQPGCEAGNNSLRRIRRTHPSEVGSRAISGGILVSNARELNRVGCKASTLSKVLMKASVALMVLGSFSSPVLAASDPDLPKCLDKLGLDDMDGFCENLRQQLSRTKTVLGVKCREGQFQLASTGSEGEMLVFNSNTNLLLYPFRLEANLKEFAEIRNKKLIKDGSLDVTKHYLVKVKRFGMNDLRLHPLDITTSLESESNVTFPEGSYIGWDNAEQVFCLQDPTPTAQTGGYAAAVTGFVQASIGWFWQDKEVNKDIWDLKLGQDKKVYGLDAESGDALMLRPWLIKDGFPYPPPADQRQVNFVMKETERREEEEAQ